MDPSSVSVTRHPLKKIPPEEMAEELISSSDKRVGPAVYKNNKKD